MSSSEVRGDWSIRRRLAWQLTLAMGLILTLVFLVLFQRFHYGSHRLPMVLDIDMLGFVLLPWNPGS